MTISVKKIKEFLKAESTLRNALITFLVIIIYLSLFFRPKIINLFFTLNEASRLKTKVVSTEKEWANIGSLKKELLQMNEKIDYYEKKLPSEKEVPAILEYLSRAAKKLNVRISEIRPIEQQEDKGATPSLYYKVPILLKAECGYHQLGRFLNKLESADRFMKINDIKVVVDPRKPNIHNVQLIVVTYVMER